MIHFDHVRRCYGSKTAVDDLDFKVPRGELFAYLGPNGAGKTTTIKMMVGLLNPTHGRIAIGGYDAVKQRREANRLLAYVPDQPYVYDKLSGREFLKFVADMHGLDSRVAFDRLQREIETFELGPFVDDLAESYSHGMKQRLIFAAAMLHDPAVLVLDEPMVGLDPRSCRLVKDLLKQRAEQGVTIFMSTHTLSVAEEIADVIGILQQGRLQFLGTLDKLRSGASSQQLTLEQMYLDLTDGPAGDLEAKPTEANTAETSPRKDVG
jgi:ABC-2 type transport system ATP-binding protein